MTKRIVGKDSHAEKYREIGARIKALRESQGKRQGEMAVILNMHRTSYAQIENGNRFIMALELHEIALALGTTFEVLYGRTGSREVKP